MKAAAAATAHGREAAAAPSVDLRLLGASQQSAGLASSQPG